MRYLAVLPALCLLFLEKVLLQDEVATSGLPAGSDAVLSSPYVDSFSCEGQAYGYFADVENNCEVSWERLGESGLGTKYLCCSLQVFHICYPLTDDTGRITEYIKYCHHSPLSPQN